MKCKKIMALALSAVLAAGMLAGCGGSSSGGGSAAIGLSQRVVNKITVDEIKEKIEFLDASTFNFNGMNLNDVLSACIENTYVAGWDPLTQNKEEWERAVTTAASSTTGSLCRITRCDVLFYRFGGNDELRTDQLISGAAGSEKLNSTIGTVDRTKPTLYVSIFAMPTGTDAENNVDIIAKFFNETHKDELCNILGGDISYSAAVAAQDVVFEPAVNDVSKVTLVAIAILR